MEIPIEHIEVPGRRAIPVKQIGQGPNMLLSTWCMHGDEGYSSTGFQEAPEKIVSELLNQHDGGDIFNDLSLLFMLVNPDGSDSGEREDDSGHDLNRCWLREFTLPHIKATQEFLEEKTRGKTVFHVDHHDDKKGTRAYFCVTLPREDVEYAARVLGMCINIKDEIAKTHPRAFGNRVFNPLLNGFNYRSNLVLEEVYNMNFRGMETLADPKERELFLQLRERLNGRLDILSDTYPAPDGSMLTYSHKKGWPALAYEDPFISRKERHITADLVVANKLISTASSNRTCS